MGPRAVRCSSGLSGDLRCKALRLGREGHGRRRTGPARAVPAVQGVEGRGARVPESGVGRWTLGVQRRAFALPRGGGHGRAWRGLCPQSTGAIGEGWWCRLRPQASGVGARAPGRAQARCQGGSGTRAARSGGRGDSRAISASLTGCGKARRQAWRAWRSRRRSLRSASVRVLSMKRR